jgi:hypothetical protein
MIKKEKELAISSLLFSIYQLGQLPAADGRTAACWAVRGRVQAKLNSMSFGAGQRIGY